MDQAISHPQGSDADDARPGPTTKGAGFVQPIGSHVHWHVDIAIITIAGTYYLCSVLDGYSRAVARWTSSTA